MSTEANKSSERREASQRKLPSGVIPLRPPTPATPAAARPELVRKSGHPTTPADRAVLPTEQAAEEGSLQRYAPAFYLNRELTLLNFYFRVLQEARDPRNPLLERLKFAAIVSSNIDEFVMKRIGGLLQQVGAGLHDRTVDGRTPEQQLEECYDAIRDLTLQVREAVRQLGAELREHDIDVLESGEFDEKDRRFLRKYYLENVHPLLTPQATDPAHPFPFISNLSLNLLVSLRDPDTGDPAVARVKVPVGAGTPRFIPLRGSGRFVALERVVLENLDVLFPGMEVESAGVFRVTRNANTELEEESADDLLEMIQSELRERKFAPVVRLQVAEGMDPAQVRMLTSELALDPIRDVYVAEGPLGLRDLMQLATLDRPELRDPPHHPVDHPLLKDDRSIFHTISDSGSVLLHHPYESFASTVERFLREAAEDPDVRAIKMTLYRTSEESNAVRYLIEAARNGKQVAVVVELKASFDEEANIGWATRLEEVGIHVTYGVLGLKTHCKVVLVVRQEGDHIRRYAHIGTGNYHAGTARRYADVGLLTADSRIGQDLTELFNYLTTGFKPRRKYKRILPAPKILKRALLDKIDREIRLHGRDGSGLLQFKMNALEDVDVVDALYRASEGGVKVDLLVRDTCRLRPGIPGLSDNVRVVSVLGRFLEHARIFYFRNGGDEEYYIGSADCMWRNLNNRVEVLAPVLDPELRAELRYGIDTQLEDCRGGWEMHSDGSYELRSLPTETQCVSSQQAFIEWSEARLRESRRLKRRRTRVITGRNLR